MIAVSSWLDDNKLYLSAALDLIKQTLEKKDGKSEKKWSRKKVNDLEKAIDPPPALQILSARLGLSNFERDLLLLCAGVELESEVQKILARIQGGQKLGLPTFSLALASLSNPLPITP